MSMSLTSSQLKILLVGTDLVRGEQFDLAEKEAKEKKRPIEEILIERGLISDEELGEIIANYLRIPFANLRKKKIDEEILGLIPEVVAISQRTIAFDKEKQGSAKIEERATLKIATPNPDNYEFFKLLERKTDCRVEIYYATSLEIDEALKYYKSDLGGQVKNLIEDLKANPQNEQNIVKLVNLFLEYAHDNRASDIHIEPLENSVSVRFRIDGVLHEVVEYTKELHDKIVFRVKIMASLRTDEHAAAQDGRFDYGADHARFDVRVSIAPVTDGENLVLRLLSERSRRLSLEELGLLAHDLEKVKRAMAKPYGMLLAAGPTGSGKTTTLYAVLQILNKTEVNIMTIEDPVEYDVEHVQQIQVNAKKNLTFATGLRSIVRQDPDIIMVGEIRDNETADIAVNAAMTGHLLLSTLHANDAATTFPRLTDMGVEPFLVSSSVNVVVAQRLVRKICDKCKMSYHFSKEDLKMIQSDSYFSKILEQVFGKKDFSKMTVYTGAGCKTCGDTGYSGRIGIFEVMEIIEAIRPLITQKASSDIIDKKAKELGMTPMLFDGLTKVSQGVTTLEEVIRATKT